MGIILGLGLYALGWAAGYMTAKKAQELVKVPVRTKTEDLYPKKNNDPHN
jgi:hypothetical protein